MEGLQPFNTKNVSTRIKSSIRVLAVEPARVEQSNTPFHKFIQGCIQPCGSAVTSPKSSCQQSDKNFTDIRGRLISFPR